MPFAGVRLVGDADVASSVHGDGGDDEHFVTSTPMAVFLWCFVFLSFSSITVRVQGQNKHGIIAYKEKLYFYVKLEAAKMSLDLGVSSVSIAVFPKTLAMQTPPPQYHIPPTSDSLTLE
ncbi:hypothetical protein ACMD2_12409 [Ananas comosus]|uniref:Uncharacterized protein n=1 Tax=Ananas comosus TaxID=4615 RepID=A0A199UXI4_ANACO|nr:hypothetical protein ACMD2_12409 [Ananas comosus]